MKFLCMRLNKSEFYLWNICLYTGLQQVWKGKKKSLEFSFCNTLNYLPMLGNFRMLKVNAFFRFLMSQWPTVSDRAKSSQQFSGQWFTRTVIFHMFFIVMIGKLYRLNDDRDLLFSSYGDIFTTSCKEYCFWKEKEVCNRRIVRSYPLLLM